MKAEELRQWREANGYSQSRLANALSVDVMTVSRWERGARGIPSFLRLALSYLEVKGDKPNPKPNQRKRK